jgi:hypothetical protein
MHHFASPESDPDQDNETGSISGGYDDSKGCPNVWIQPVLAIVTSFVCFRINITVLYICSVILYMYSAILSVVHLHIVLIYVVLYHKSSRTCMYMEICSVAYMVV